MIAAIRNGEWHLGWGDPGIPALLITVLYFVAALQCWRAGRLQPGVQRRFWMLLAVGITALGINKQADLQTLMTLTARHVLQAAGLYDSRRVLQLAFLATLAVLSVVMVMVAIVLARRMTVPSRIAIAGVILQLGFVVMRAASFHHADRLLGISVGFTNLNHVLESVSLVVIVMAALMEINSVTRRQVAGGSRVGRATRDLR